ncbi:MAG: LysR family transcriptional regulator [Pseudomonadota bacterium]
MRHLKTLATIRECGNLARAAQRLHQTQSALSHQLKSIEHYYEAPLLIRKSKPLQFTPLGLRLLALADDILPRVASAERELRQLAGGSQGRLHVAMECHSCFEWLMPTMDIYREEWPEVEMDISVGFAFEPLAALTRGQVDLVVTSDPRDLQGVHFEPLFGYQALLAIDKSNPLSRQKRIAPDDLADQTLITYPVETARLDIYRDFLTPAGITPAGRRTAELTAMILQLVASGRGVAALPNWVLTEYLDKQYVVARPLGDDGLWGTVYAAVRKSDLELAYMRAFLDQAKDTVFDVLADIKPAS